MSVEQMFAEARARIYAMIEARCSLFLRETAYLGEHHRRSLGQRFRKPNPRKGHPT